MAAYIDQRLVEKIREAGETGMVDAVIVVKEREGTYPAMDDEGLALQVVEFAAGRTGELPGTLRFFPRANAAVISASARFIQEILENENLAAASAADIEAMIVPDT